MPGPPLTEDKPLNPRQELFCLALARGMSQRAAYLAAGYKDGRHAWRLMEKPNVVVRVAELRAASAARNEVSVDSITARAMAIVENNEGSESLAAQRLALRGLMDVARMHGFMRPKPPLSASELDQIAEGRRILDFLDGRTDAAGNPIEPRRAPYDPGSPLWPDDDDPQDED